jgi:hypothetical protein
VLNEYGNGPTTGSRGIACRPGLPVAFLPLQVPGVGSFVRALLPCASRCSVFVPCALVSPLRAPTVTSDRVDLY